MGRFRANHRAAGIDDGFNEAVDQALAESIARYEFMLKQSQNMFLAILGHDLRNPLETVVAGSSFLMQAIDIPSRYCGIEPGRRHNLHRDHASLAVGIPIGPGRDQHRQSIQISISLTDRAVRCSEHQYP